MGRKKKEGQQTEMGTLLGHTSREAVLYCVSAQALGEGLVIFHLAFLFFCLSLARVCPTLLPSNVAWALWAATGEPGPRRVQSCWGKGELLPPLQSALFLRTPRSVVAKVVKTGSIAYHNNALSNAHRRGTRGKVI